MAFGHAVEAAARGVARQIESRILPALGVRDVLGFCYHAVTDAPSDHLVHLRAHASRKAFGQDLEYLARNFDVVGYDDLSCAAPRGRGWRPRAILTFDDGLREVWEHVRPELLRMGLPATVFVTTDFLDNRRLFFRHKISLCLAALDRLPAPDVPRVTIALGTALGVLVRDVASVRRHLLGLLTLTAEREIDAACAVLGVDCAGCLVQQRPYMTTTQVQQLAADGFTIGAHGLAHGSVGAMAPAEAEADIVGSCAAVAAITGAASVPYSFPFSGRSVDRTLLATIRATHPHVGLLFETRVGAADRDFVVHRVAADCPDRRTDAARSDLPLRVMRAGLTLSARALDVRKSAR